MHVNTGFESDWQQPSTLWSEQVTKANWGTSTRCPQTLVLTAHLLWNKSLILQQTICCTTHQITSLTSSTTSSVKFLKTLLLYILTSIHLQKLCLILQQHCISLELQTAVAHCYTDCQQGFMVLALLWGYFFPLPFFPFRALPGLPFMASLSSFLCQPNILPMVLPNAASSSTHPLSTWGSRKSKRSPPSYSGMPKGAIGMMMPHLGSPPAASFYRHTTLT